MILKFLLWTFVISYLVYKIGGFLMRSMLFVFGRKLQNEYSQQQKRTYESQQYAESGFKKKPSDGNVTIEYIPEDNDKKEKKDFRGGDYVDYEEIK
jgi:hypothetical protein